LTQSASVRRTSAQSARQLPSQKRQVRGGQRVQQTGTKVRLCGSPTYQANSETERVACRREAARAIFSTTGSSLAKHSAWERSSVLGVGAGQSPALPGAIGSTLCPPYPISDYLSHIAVVSLCLFYARKPNLVPVYKSLSFSFSLHSTELALYFEVRVPEWGPSARVKLYVLWLSEFLLELRRRLKAESLSFTCASPSTLTGSFEAESSPRAFVFEVHL